MRTLNMDAVREGLKFRPTSELGTLQTAIYVAAGGGFVGKMYAENPADAYVDDRVSTPYSENQLENMRLVLVEFAKDKGLDPHKLPAMLDFHHCGIW